LKRLARHASKHDRVLDKVVGPAYKPEFLAALRRIIHAFDAKADPTV
jgi:hypothetical protein